MIKDKILHLSITPDVIFSIRVRRRRQLTITDGAVDAASSRNLDLIVWAYERLNLPLGVSRRAADMAVARQVLETKNVTVAREPDMAIANGGVRLCWLAPSENMGEQQ